MKTLIFSLLTSISIGCFAQIDSANSKPSVTVQARDIAYWINFVGTDIQFRVMDSVFCRKLSGGSAPSGTTPVQCDSIKAKHWIALFQLERIDALAQDGGVFTRLKTALNNTSFSWIVTRVTASDNAAQQAVIDLQTLGRHIARRELDNQ